MANTNAELAQGIVVVLADAVALGSGNGKWLEQRIVSALSTAESNLAREVLEKIAGERLEINSENRGDVAYKHGD